ncbi:MAG: phage tail protein [Solirubrobacteraceae bacterium]
MSEPFLGEIRLFSMGFAPKDWALCDGQLLAISQNQALFSILGTTYGGDGIQTFALPDLRGRVPVHTGNDVTLGQQLGAESQTLTSAEMAEHTHTVQGSPASGTSTLPAGNVLAASAGAPYAPLGGATVALAQTSSSGGGQPHENRQPYLTISFCIALQGIFPSQN